MDKRSLNNELRYAVRFYRRLNKSSLESLRLWKKLTKKIVWVSQQCFYGIKHSKKVENRLNICPRLDRPVTISNEIDIMSIVMMLICFNYKIIIYQHKVPQGIIVNVDHYIEALKTFEIHIGRKWNHLILKWLLHYDNAHLHTAVCVL